MIKKLIFLILILISPMVAEAAYQTLYTISPRASGTGTPAIPSTHRIFFAYPGIEYKIRAQTVGGDYPYTYQLTNAPTGMTVDASGYIRWTDPQTTASNITLRVTDSSAAYVETTWSIAVQTAGFKFVDDVASNGDGTLASPFNSMENMVTGSASTDIIYFRAGNYDVPYYGGGSFPMSTVGGPVRPHKWLGYPGETATIDFNDTGYIYCYSNSLQDLYFDGLTFSNAKEYVVRGDATYNYVTFLDNTFSNINSDTATNNNQGTYYTGSGATTGKFLAFQGNTMTDYGGVQGVGSLYNQDTLLVEGNTFTNFHDATTGSNCVLAFKLGISHLTLRGNVINLADVAADFSISGSSTNGMFADGTPYPGQGFGGKSEFNEILYNFFSGVSGNDLNRYNDQGTTWIHHNTYNSTLQFTWLAEGSCEGPWYINNNAFQNASSGPSDHGGNTVSWTTCVTERNNNIGATTGIVDSSGLLTVTYASSIGVAGWQFSDGTTPIDGTYVPDPPTPIPGVCGTANGVPSATEPTTGLCASGTPGTVTRPSNWSWPCLGIDGGADADPVCSAPYIAPSGSVHLLNLGGTIYSIPVD